MAPGSVAGITKWAIFYPQKSRLIKLRIFIDYVYFRETHNYVLDSSIGDSPTSRKIKFL
jgi:hypothetical protein